MCTFFRSAALVAFNRFQHPIKYSSTVCCAGSEASTGRNSRSSLLGRVRLTEQRRRRVTYDMLWGSSSNRAIKMRSTTSASSCSGRPAGASQTSSRSEGRNATYPLPAILPRDSSATRPRTKSSLPLRAANSHRTQSQRADKLGHTFNVTLNTVEIVSSSQRGRSSCTGAATAGAFFFNGTGDGATTTGSAGRFGA